ncbi:hypothetical protein KBY85_01155 [Cyanobium sp. BA5m-10]|uniref:hypothetical protein n=1 Tax=Cyanobium sp. BA5m-10 TaxID=2823705 RepID=UPI0020CE1A17|nr:hypothetical protein [Cyanobium sp. BA5m-10]MCP9902751.1 hypothetical protein [Cyanobium sp. BA5m-10]
MALLSNHVVQADDAGHDRMLTMAKAAAAIAALECADDRYEFARIHRSILTAMQQTFPEIFDFDATELC